MLTEFAHLGGELVILSGGLEPLVGPAIAAAQTATELGLRVHLYTSGLSASLDNLEECRSLLRGVERIRFSINAIRPETYRAIQTPNRPGRDDLRDVSRRVRGLVALRLAAGLRCEIGVGFVTTALNAPELMQAARQWSAAGVDFFDALADIDGDRSLSRDVQSELEKLRRCHRELAPLKVRVSGRSGRAPRIARSCAVPRKKITVDPYGLVWRCCHVAGPERSRPDLCIGDLRQSDLASILSSPLAAPRETNCTTCPDWERTFNAVAAE